MTRGAEQGRRGPKKSWWAEAKTRKQFNDAMAARVAEGMPLIATTTTGVMTTTGATIAKLRARNKPETAVKATRGRR